MIIELFGDGSDTKTGGKPRIKSSTVSPPLKLCFSQEEIWLLKASQAEIERIGIRFLISQSSESSEDVSVLVDSVPSVFVEREFSEVKRGRPSVAVDNVKVLSIILNESKLKFGKSCSCYNCNAFSFLNCCVLNKFNITRPFWTSLNLNLALTVLTNK